MIRSQKRALLGGLVRGYVGRKLRRHFRGLYLKGQLPTPRADGGGIVLYANHSSFWDGFAAHELSRASGWDGHALMDEQNLSRYRFLRHLGAFSIRRGEAGSTLESFREARRLLSAPRTAVWLFPEGEQRVPGEGPLRLERGLEVLLRRTGCVAVPLGIRYTFLDGEYPDILVQAGAPHGPLPLPSLAERLQAVVDSVFAARSLEGFKRLVRGRAGAREQWDAVRGLGTVRA